MVVVRFLRRLKTLQQEDRGRGAVGFGGDPKPPRLRRAIAGHEARSGDKGQHVGCPLLWRDLAPLPFLVELEKDARALLRIGERFERSRVATTRPSRKRVRVSTMSPP